MDKKYELTQETFSYLPCSLCVVKNDEDFSIIYANAAFYNLFGYSESEVQYKFRHKLNALLDPKAIKSIQKAISDPVASTFELEYNITNTHVKNLWTCSFVDFSHLETENIFYFVSYDISRYKKTELDLSHLKEKTAFILQSTALELIDFEKDTGKIKAIRQTGFFGNRIKVGDMFPDCLIQEKIVDSEHIENLQKISERLIQGETSSFTEVLLTAKDSTPKWFALSLHKDGSKENSVITAIFNNITAEKEATLNYLNEALFYRAIINFQDAYGHVDLTEDRILRVGGLWNPYNEWINEITYTALFQKFVYKIVHIEDRVQYAEILNCQNLYQAYQNGITHLSCEFRRIVEQNKMVWMSISLELFENPLNHHLMVLLYLKNIDLLKKQHSLLEYEAGHDALTNLHNKNGALACIKEYKELMKESELSAFILLNIDDFRSVNSECGYERGDQILSEIALILSKAFRKYDIISRFGGDEFLVCVKNIESIENVERRLDNVIECLETELSPPVTMSIGIAYMNHLDDFQQVIGKSEMALQEAKRSGKNRYCVYKEKHADAFPTSHLFADSLADSYQSDDLRVGQMSEFETYLSTYNEMAYLIDPKSFVLLCGNKAFYDRIGLTDAECNGMKCYKLIHHRTHPCPFCGFSSWTTEKFHIYRIYNEVLEQEYLIKSKLIQWRNQEVLFTISVDLSNDKNLISAVGNGVTEDHAILNGVQAMHAAADIDGVVVSALEAVGKFFRASFVQLWLLDAGSVAYYNKYSWLETNVDACPASPDKTELERISRWLFNRKWTENFFVENKEEMLCSSYDLYQRMEKYHFINQNWFLILDESGSEIGILEINNVSTNFTGHDFLRSFSKFITVEWQKRKTVEALIRSGFYDSMTGLLNRASYERFIVDFTDSSVHSIGAIFINIDGLKKINESLGYYTGNSYIIQLAEMLNATFPNQAKYRLSGDEFLVIVSDVTQKDVEHGIAALQDALSDLKLFSTSIGYAWDNVEKEPETLVAHATQNMKINKARYHASLETDSNERVELLGWTMSAIKERRMLVYLQPKIDSRTDAVIGAEALVRYIDKQDNIVPPTRFIAPLEKSNLIRYIDFFVLEEACKTLQYWETQKIDAPPISINFSRITMSENDLLTSMDNIINKYGISKDKIEIEITESDADIGKALLIRASKNLHMAGYPIALDDFGTKYSNLSILSEIDAHILKIDKSLVHSVVEDNKTLIILRNVIQMCKDLSIEVIAEGVETIEQKDLLEKLGCYYIQGFYYSQPIGIKLFEEKYFTS